ncbi:MAG: flagellar M-ring protein FliF [Azospirillum sp.]|nr:flagellar M-ring protein FliF [Azospirillum sp.]
MNSFAETLRNLGPARLAAIGAIGLAVIGFFIYLTGRLTTPPMELLYGELAAADAAAIGKRLDELKITYKVDPTGTRVFVPSDQVGRLRMQMAAAGIPAGGSVGYEIFDKSEGFGATSFIQNMNQLRSLEGELARTIGTLSQVQQARVHLVLPRRELFSRTQNKSTASVFLKLRSQIGREQVAAIQHLVASSVPNLDPSQISIIDDKGNLLARGTASDSNEAIMANAEEKKVAYEQRMARVIEDLLGRSLGFGKVRAQVSAELDFDRITTNSDLFDPNAQVVRSTQSVNESSDAQDRDPLEAVTVNNNLPNANQQASRGNSPISSNRTTRNEETINYEISRTQRTVVRESGNVRRQSVAVLVDGDYKPDPNGGAPIYTPRPKEEMDQLAALVRSAVGFDAQRGDSLEVVNMRFASAAEEFAPAELGFLGIPKEDLFRIGEMLVLGIVAVLVILLVVRPLITRAFERPAEVDSEMDKLLTEGGAPAVLAAPSGALAQDLALEAAQADEELEQMIDINRVEGRVRASSLRKVGEIVDKHPEEAVAILRNWLYQET